MKPKRMRRMVTVLVIAATCDVYRSGDGWRTEYVEDYLFSLPPRMTVVPVKGIDSEVGEYTGPAMRANYDYGMYGDDLSNWPKNGSVRTTRIGGQVAKVGWATVHDSSGYPYVSTLHVTNLTIDVSYRDPSARAIAERIFRSVRRDPVSDGLIRWWRALWPWR